MLVQHLFINTEEMLDPALHLTLDLRVLHMAADFCLDLVDEALPGLPGQGDFLLQIFIDLRLQIPERQIIQFNLNFGNTKAVRQRRINLNGFSGLFLLLLRLHVLQGPHVMETVGQFN